MIFTILPELNCGYQQDTISGYQYIYKCQFISLIRKCCDFTRIEDLGLKNITMIWDFWSVYSRACNGFMQCVMVPKGGCRRIPTSLYLWLKRPSFVVVVYAEFQDGCNPYQLAFFRSVWYFIPRTLILWINHHQATFAGNGWLSSEGFPMQVLLASWRLTAPFDKWICGDSLVMAAAPQLHSADLQRLEHRGWVWYVPGVAITLQLHQTSLAGPTMVFGFAKETEKNSSFVQPQSLQEIMCSSPAYKQVEICEQ